MVELVLNGMSLFDYFIDKRQNVVEKAGIWNGPSWRYCVNNDNYAIGFTLELGH